jgi:hypothetical protein
MKKLTRKLMIATAALVVGAGAASAQTLRAQIPFAFRAGNKVLAPGAYYIDNLRSVISAPVFRISNVHSGRSITVLAQVPVDPQKGWAQGNGMLVFACVSGDCTLAEIWSGSESHAYAFSRPKVGKGEEAYLREIPLQPGKGE